MKPCMWSIDSIPLTTRPTCCSTTRNSLIDADISMTICLESPFVSFPCDLISYDQISWCRKLGAHCYFTRRDATCPGSSRDSVSFMSLAESSSRKKLALVPVRKAARRICESWKLRFNAILQPQAAKSEARPVTGV